jgi:hypothetical protein
MEDFDSAEDYIIYNITVRKAIGPEGRCTQTSMNIIGWTKANFTFIESCNGEGTKADPQLEGKMYFQCCDTTGACYSTHTSPIGVCSSAGTIQAHLDDKCPWFANKISVH